MAHQKKRYTVNSLGLFILIASAQAANAEQETQTTTHFTSHFFVNQNNTNIDISHLEKGQGLIPGIYPLSISVNGTQVTDTDVEVISQENGTAPCITHPLAVQLGINTAYYSRYTDITMRCIDIAAAPNSFLTLNAKRMNLDIRVPQIALTTTRQLIEPNLWNKGINNFRMNYLASGSKQSRDQQSSRSQFYTDLNLGADINGIHFRSNLNYSDSTGQEADWQSKESYAYTAIPSLRSELTAGETFLRSNLIDGFAFTGISLGTDRAMLEPRFQGYAPVIRGIAQSNARVSITQNSYTIYEQFVPPGEFAIDDIPSLSNGDLTVTITEEDGSQKRFVQPYTQIPNLVRPGLWEYAITAGKYRNDNTDEPWFINAEISHGLDNDVTLFGASLVSQEYSIHTMGVGFNLGKLGGFSVDASRSYFRPDEIGKDADGNSYRFFYAKSLTRSTNIQILGYRYSTEGFRTFNEAVIESNGSIISQRKSRTEATLTQSLGSYGSLYVTGSQEKYWKTKGERNFLVSGYSNNYKDMNYSLSFSHNENLNGKLDNTVSISASLPLGSKNRRPTYINYQQTHSDAGTDFNAGISGLLSDERFSYNVTSGRSNDDLVESSARLSYSGQSTGITAGTSHSKYHDLYFAQAGGSVLVHKGGIIFGRRLGETAIIADTGGVEDVTFQTGALPITTNSKGMALLPQVQPYRQQEVSMDFSKLDANLETSNRSHFITPERGAVSLAKFNIYPTQRFLVRIMGDNGQVAPFGSLIVDADGNNVSTIDSSGYALINHTQNQSSYFIPGTGCTFSLPDQIESAPGITIIDKLICVTSGDN